MYKIKKFSILLGVIAFSLTTAIVGAQVVVSTAIYQSLFSVTNSSIATTNEVVGFPYSGFTLVDQNFMNADTLNSVVTDTSSTSIPAMPPSTRLSYQSAKQDDGGVFTTYTTEINSPSVFDVNFFPPTPTVSDAFYFGLNSPGRILTVDIGVPGNYDYTLVWEYFNGTSWVSFTNFVDDTNSFESIGIGLVTFDLPTDWKSTSIDSVTSYWIRARIDTFVSVTTSVLGTQAWWETGTWFVYSDSIGENVQRNYLLFMGGSTDLVTNQQIFPGNEGIVTTDDLTLEIGGSAFSIVLEGAFDVDSVSGNYLTKTGAIIIDNPASGEIRVIIDDGVGTSIASVTGVTSGEFIITVSSDGVTLTIAVSGVGSASTTMRSITDNANAWIWGDGDTTRYFEEISITFPSILEDWNVSGSFGDNGTFTEAIEFLNTNIYTSIGVPAIAPTGSTFHGSNLWIMDSNDLYEIDETNANTVSNCIVANIGATAVTSDGTNLWYTSTAATDVIEINTSCVLQSQFDISSIYIGVNGIAYNTSTSRLAVFSSPSSNPTISIYQTGGTQDSSNTITAMSNVGDITIIAAEYYDGFYYVTAQHSGALIQSLWKMTDYTDAIPIYRISRDMYGYGGIDNTIGSILPIQPGTFPFAFQDLAIDPATGNVYSYPGVISNSASTVYQTYLTYTLGDILTAHVRSGNDYQRNIPFWTDFDDISGQRSGLNTNNPFYGNYGVIFSRISAGWADTQQVVTGFTPGNTYSFGVVVTCTGENNELNVQWEESDGTPIGSLLVSSISGCGPQTQLSLNNKVAPALATQVTLEIQHYCTGSCSGLDYSYWDGVQAIEAIVVEPFPTTSINLVQNPSFEMIYETGEFWTSNSLPLGTVTNVSSSIISWGETLFSDSSLLVETSINAGGLYTTATNGSAIPLIVVGADLTGISLLVRVTLNPSTDQESTAQLDSMQLSVLDTSDFTLRYQLNDIPRIIINDRVGSNNGTLSFPLITNNTLVSSAGPLTTIAGAASVSGDASTPDIVDQITPGDITSATIFSNNIPLSDLWIALSALSNGDVPPIMFWIITAMVVILASGSYTFLYTGSVPWTAGAMGMFTLGFINFGGGVLPFWVFFFFGIMAIATSIFSKVKAM